MRIFRFLVILIFLASMFERVSGTAQIPDFLIYNGDTLPIYTNPLESYFNNTSRPDNVFDKYGYSSTACWRGYIGYWKLKNDSLFLIELHGDSSKIDLSLIFKNAKTNSKIFADWFDFPINNPYGKLIHYEHMGYASIYEYEREFIFKKGILTSIKIYDNSKSKKCKYTLDNKLLIDFIKANTNNSLLPDTIDKVMVFVQIKKVSAEGKIENVTVVRGFNKTLDEEAIRVVKSIPEWDILYRHGEVFNMIWTIPVTFENTN